MTTLLTVLLPLADKAPAPEDVKQGWLGFAVFLGLVAAVVLLWFSFRKQLKKVDFEEKDDNGNGDGSKPGKSGGDAPDNGNPTPA